MTVQELIDALSAMNADSSVYVMQLDEHGTDLSVHEYPGLGVVIQ